MEKQPKLAAALGFFDGVHMAHKAVLQMAADAGQESMALVIHRPGGPGLITPAQKQAAIYDTGVTHIKEYAFEDIRGLSCEEFVQNILKKELGLSVAVCGYNFHFGHGGTGDSDLLQTLCRKAGMEALVAPPVFYEGEAVSSTRVRTLLSQGDIEKANILLTRPFSYDFEIVHGQKMGRTLGAPTLNQYFSGNYCLPKFGVYASKVVIDGQTFYGATNIGMRPTVGSHRPVSETWMPDYQGGELYGQEISVALHHFIRAERTFEGVEALRTQIHADGQAAKEYFAGQ